MLIGDSCRSSTHALVKTRFFDQPGSRYLHIRFIYTEIWHVAKDTCQARQFFRRDDRRPVRLRIAEVRRPLEGGSTRLGPGCVVAAAITFVVAAFVAPDALVADSLLFVSAVAVWFAGSTD